MSLKASLAKIQIFLCSFCLCSLQPTKSFSVEGFDSLCLLNLEDNSIAEWDEILKLSQLKRLDGILSPSTRDSDLELYFISAETKMEFQLLLHIFSFSNNL